MQAKFRSLFRYSASRFAMMFSSPRRNFGKEIGLLEIYLWSGRSSEAVQHFEAMIASPEVPDNVKNLCRTSLACWHYHNGDARRALEVLRAGLTGGKRALEQSKFWRTILALHLALGNFADARKILDEANRFETTYAKLLAASAVLDDDDRLSRLNEIFRLNGLSELTRRENEPLTFKSLRGSCRPNSIPDIGKVSVIVPVYNREETLAYSVQSVCDQTYGNLEILIVDDASSDNSLKVAKALAAQDDRISIVQHGSNLGAYQARNTGLAAASGDFVTVQDSDDWSHPQRIELQMSAFAEGVLAVGSYWARLSKDLRIARWKLSGGAPVKNYWSVVFRYHVFEDIGKWDPIRFAADGNLLRRLEAFGGSASVHWVARTVPLAFGLYSEGTLTTASRTHKMTSHNGPRHFYTCLTNYWHETLGKVGPEEQSDRIAMLPDVFFQKDTSVAKVTLCLQGDFSKPERVLAAKQYVDGETGLVALFNLPDFSISREESFELCAEYFELLQTENVVCIFDPAEVSAGSTVTL